MKTSPLLLVALCAFLAIPAHARLITRAVPYVQDGVQLEGYLAYDDAYPMSSSGRAGVLIAHEWWGLNDYVRVRAHQLAGLGYVAFALDMYGKGVYTTHATTAARLAKPFYGSPLMADRARAGLDEFIKTGLVDPKRIAAIGYCFGGTTVLSLAFGGAPLKAVACFHGGLIPAPADAAKAVHARFLICHGAIDPFVPKQQVDAFLASMNEQKLDFEFVEYAGAVHAFTNPDADDLARDNNLKGIGYSATADRRSWTALKALLGETLGPN